MSKYYSNKPVYAELSYNRVVDQSGSPLFKNGKTTWPTPYGSMWDFRNGQSMPNYRQRIKARQAVSSSFLYQKWDVKETPAVCRFHYLYKPTGVTVNASLIGNAIQFPNWPQFYSGSLNSLISDATTDFLRKAYAKQHTFSGGVFLGELNQVVSMFRSPLKSLVDGMFDYLFALRRRKRAIKRKRKGSRSDELKAINDMIAGTWLEYSFGWKQTLRDLDDAVSTLAKLTTYYDPTEHVVGSSKIKQVLNGPFVNDSVDGFYRFFSYRSVTTMEVECKVIGGIFARSQTTGIGSVLQPLGLGIGHTFPTIWNLIPLSFLVDYVVNVNDCIEAASFRQSDIIYVTQTIHSTVDMTAGDVTDYNALHGAPNYQIFDDKMSLGSTTLKGVLHDRAVLIPGQLLPSLRWSEPISKKPLRIANVAALAASAASTSRYLRM